MILQALDIIQSGYSRKNKPEEIGRRSWAEPGYFSYLFGKISEKISALF